MHHTDINSPKEAVRKFMLVLEFIFKDSRKQG